MLIIVMIIIVIILISYLYHHHHNTIARDSLLGIVTTAGLIGTSVIEFINHHPVLSMLGFK
jgi:hypothetical protein